MLFRNVIVGILLAAVYVVERSGVVHDRIAYLLVARESPADLTIPDAVNVTDLVIRDPLGLFLKADNMSMIAMRDDVAWMPLVVTNHISFTSMHALTGVDQVNASLYDVDELLSGCVDDFYITAPPSRDDDVDFLGMSSDLVCSELELFDNTIEQSSRQLRCEDNQNADGSWKLSCNCGPMYNVSRSVVTSFVVVSDPSNDEDGENVGFHDDKDDVVIMTNIRILPLPLGRSFRTKTKLWESQHTLYPEHLGKKPVLVERFNRITVEYDDYRRLRERCAVDDDDDEQASTTTAVVNERRQRTFVREHAWCIQSCVDLLHGKTIYQ